MKRYSTVTVYSMYSNWKGTNGDSTNYVETNGLDSRLLGNIDGKIQTIFITQYHKIYLSKLPESKV